MGDHLELIRGAYSSSELILVNESAKFHNGPLPLQVTAYDAAHENGLSSRVERMAERVLDKLVDKVVDVVVDGVVDGVADGLDDDVVCSQTNGNGNGNDDESQQCLRSPYSLVNDHGILVLVNEQAEAAETASIGLPFDQHPRIHRLSRKAPLVDDEDEEAAEAAEALRWHSLDSRPSSKQRAFLRVPSLPVSPLSRHSNFAGGSGTGTGVSGGATGVGNSESRNKLSFTAALHDPFYLMRQRMVEPHHNEALNRIRKAVNKMMGFMFSHLDLFLVVVVYAMLGGIMFPPMEQDTEIARRLELETRTKNMSESLLEIIYNVSLSLLSSSEYHVDDELIRMCEELRQHEVQPGPPPRSTTTAVTDYRLSRRRRYSSLRLSRSRRSAEQYAKFARLWQRQHHNRLKKQIEEHITKFKRDVYIATMNGWDGETIDKQTQWTFAGSTLYSITVITTIGYGHLVPRTLGGRVVTILYALVGIPLTLLCVASMGSLFASMFRESYMYFYVRWCAPRVRVKRSDSPAGNNQRNRTSRFQTLKKRLMPWHAREHHQMLAQCLYNSAMACGNIGNRKLDRFDDQCSTLQAIKRDSQKLLFRQKVRVPVYITLLGIVFYMLLGASMFSIWEGWTFFEAFYFSFITLSTIGFGDYVPGTTLKQQEEDSQSKLVLCCLYLIFGLGMMSMTIQLMQDSVKESFIMVAQKLGIIEKKDNSITAQTKEKTGLPTS